jgi:hypothetical protein
MELNPQTMRLDLLVVALEKAGFEREGEYFVYDRSDSGKLLYTDRVKIGNDKEDVVLTRIRKIPKAEEVEMYGSSAVNFLKASYKLNNE